MQKQLIYLIVGFCLWSCGQNQTERKQAENSSSEKNENTETDNKKEVVQETIDYKHLYGFYVGPFNSVKYEEKEKLKYTNKINIALEHIEADSVYGYSVVGGNKRKFKGKFTKKDTLWIVEAKEAGDDPYDRIFNINFHIQRKTMEGIWKPYDKKLSEAGHEFSLVKKDFKYEPTRNLSADMIPVYNSYNEKSRENEFITPDAGKINASTHQLTTKDVENMYKRDLEIMRNTIYARHGYAFKNRKMRDFFDNYVDWYIPVSTDVTKELTDLEVKNIELIKRYEKYATSYYDSFGR